MVEVPPVHAHAPYEPAEDVEETEAYCERCDAVRTFRRGTVDFARVEEQSATPNVARALEGEEGWLCATCGLAKLDLVDEEAYSVAEANVQALAGAPPEQTRREQLVTEDPLLKAQAGDVAPDEPAIEAPEVREPAGEEEFMQEIGEEDPDLRHRILDDVRAQERGEEDLHLPHGAKRELPPPERLPPRDRTAEE
jgi:hypothetical protein